jgi:ABC-type Fe3+/spermidine/putrescine transport system ATPase subunit
LVKTEAGIVRAQNGAKGDMRGHPVLCSVRPESVRLRPVEGSLPELMNQLTGEVQSIMYRGDSEEYSLRLSGGALLRAVQHDQTTRKAQVGERLTVQFDPRDVVVLPQEESND